MSALKGKVAIVTGGGRGIGRAHAIRLAQEGAAVLVNDLGGEQNGEGPANAAPAEEVVATIKAAGGRAAVDTTDVGDWDAARGVVDAALKTFNRLDIVVNNAGMGRGGGIESLSKFDWDRTIAVNLTGAAAITHWAAMHWSKQGPEAGRRIINTTSGVGLTPMPGAPPYTAAKAALAALTISFAAELAPLGVRVNGLAPVARSRISERVAGALMNPPETGFDRMSPDNVAALMAYLASPMCAFTGRIFGLIGDSLVIYDGWTVAQDFAGNGKRWELADLVKTLGTAPAQQQVKMHGIMGPMPNPTPGDATLKALLDIEQR